MSISSLTTPIDDAVTPLPIPDSTPPVTTMILRSALSEENTGLVRIIHITSQTKPYNTIWIKAYSRLSETRDSSVGGRDLMAVLDAAVR